jgi:hypothetical protein
MSEAEQRWVARLTPSEATTVETLLALPLGFDVWERHADSLVVAATETQLVELERRRVAAVDRLSTVADYVARWEFPPDRPDRKGDR